MYIVREVLWPLLRCVLPYPDLPRRLSMRRAAYKLITCEPWPQGKETGTDAAQAALLRILDLQRQVQREVRSRHRDAAALLARAALETYILGAWCLYTDDPVKQLLAADNKAARRVLSFLTDDDLITLEAINASADAIGKPGPVLNLRGAAQWLGTEHRMSLPINLYDRYYVPLSHFYAHPSAFALTRHVRPGGKLRRRPAPAWARRSPARLTDACTALLAAAIAHKTGASPDRFTRYAIKHLDRTVVPALTIALQGLRQSANWRKLPQTYRIMTDVRDYLHGPGKTDDQAAREARVRTGFEQAFALLQLNLPDDAVTPVIDGLVSQVLRPLDDETPKATQQATT